MPNVTEGEGGGGFRKSPNLRDVIYEQPLMELTNQLFHGKNVIAQRNKMIQSY